VAALSVSHRLAKCAVFVQHHRVNRLDDLLQAAEQPLLTRSVEDMYPIGVCDTISQGTAVKQMFLDHTRRSRRAEEGSGKLKVTSPRRTAMASTCVWLRRHEALQGWQETGAEYHVLAYAMTRRVRIKINDASC
jgi:hypothetical protein